MRVDLSFFIQGMVEDLGVSRGITQLDFPAF